ncbi:M3 family oligoendopeptidase [Tengunoibacter tsumagoiensis]|uniref:Oligoendopeptidase F n=1 Tax=Tengunoibacter tsumagoiensis TaxID=2014871 RepID=A0A402AAL2_9CHLR|nr:M3 family oligoendopeptidase [Tengunoibacter tsumagoiensis]GCE16197.1 oligoendopeptidase F [Tengunoibacter tsumagoiensis]
MERLFLPILNGKGIVMFSPLPRTSEEFELLEWEQIKPWYHELLQAPLTPEFLSTWLKQWSDLSALLDETMVRFEVASTQNTSDEDIARRKLQFLQHIYAPAQTQAQPLKERLLASGLEPENFAIPLRNMRAEAQLYREENLALLNEDKALSDEYFQIGGAQMVSWEGKEVSIISLQAPMADTVRSRREQAWRTIAQRRLLDRKKLEELWIKKMRLRQRIAENAGLESYREYRWQKLLRFDYTPADCKIFHQAVEKVIVPAANQIFEKRRQLLNIETTRPWDVGVDPRSSVAPRAITDVEGVLQQCVQLFELIHPDLGRYLQTLLQENFVDLEERPNKAHMGYNLPLEVKRRAFIFGHLDLLSELITLVCHEAGHAFHVFETNPLPYIQQRQEGAVPIEFAEVASTSMEFIGSMYLHQTGLCSQEEARLLRIQHLERMLASYLPTIIRGDAFQHWAYENLEQALDPALCAQKWIELTKLYQPAIDWSGLEEEMGMGWLWISHFFDEPFYYIEYAFAAIGAYQVWNNYLHNPEQALQQYRHALSLGATRSVPQLYEAAGAKFVGDVPILELVRDLTLHHLQQLES